MSKKKCICKNCDDCKLFLPWKMTNDHGQERFETKCLLLVLADEIPRIRGSVDGLQSGVNEARNRSMETLERVENFGNGVNAIVQSIQTSMNQLVETNQKLLGGTNNAH